MTEWPSFEIWFAWLGARGEWIFETCGKRSMVRVISVITARKAGSWASSFLFWTKTISPISSTLTSNPSLMILSALAASPTFESEVSRYLVPIAVPIANDATTNASQPNTAVFQWFALQRPIRAAKLFECFSGDIRDLLAYGVNEGRLCCLVGP